MTEPEPNPATVVFNGDKAVIVYSDGTSRVVRDVDTIKVGGERLVLLRQNPVWGTGVTSRGGKCEVSFNGKVIGTTTSPIHLTLPADGSAPAGYSNPSAIWTHPADLNALEWLEIENAKPELNRTLGGKERNLPCECGCGRKRKKCPRGG